MDAALVSLGRSLDKVTRGASWIVCRPALHTSSSTEGRNNYDDCPQALRQVPVSDKCLAAHHPASTEASKKSGGLHNILANFA